MILIVEDNAANQLLVSAVLDREGYRIELTASAIEAREVIDRGLPNLILMDVQLPGVDGLTFTRQLKADPVTAHIPVVALTALAMSGDRERALAAGCAGYISKPINTRTFADEVRGYLLAKA
ncbi:MAG TPA: response regulator [Candidatus Eisenbacteria bacterium]|nr:response regulator [Candidatus Eisenbacteria bacterium]